VLTPPLDVLSGCPAAPREAPCMELMELMERISDAMGRHDHDDKHAEEDGDAKSRGQTKRVWLVGVFARRELTKRICSLNAPPCAELVHGDRRGSALCRHPEPLSIAHPLSNRADFPLLPSRAASLAPPMATTPSCARCTDELGGRCGPTTDNTSGTHTPFTYALPVSQQARS
jgi:hypothetical protein